MKFTFVHNSINVLDLEKSLDFYRKALSLEEVRRLHGPEGRFELVFLGGGDTPHQLELTWLRDRKTSYSLGDNEFHLAFTVKEFDKAYELHKDMGCICYENKEMGLYFINDPDGYWIEILPEEREHGSPD